jgi:hypothetical protein
MYRVSLRAQAARAELKDDPLAFIRFWGRHRVLRNTELVLPPPCPLFPLVSSHFLTASELELELELGLGLQTAEVQAAET